MDRRAVIERLEDLRDHCQSMIDKDDPASIWWGDTEALTEAIKALSLDIDKNQKGETDMTSEVKVTIVAHDGTTKEITGDIDRRERKGTRPIFASIGGGVRKGGL